MLEVLVTKTGTIKRELGSLSRVIDDDVERRLRSHGIRHREADDPRHEAELGQLSLAFAREEMRQLEADMRHWRRRLDRFERDLEHEPARVREFYEVRARRVEPVGLVYLWPETN